MNYINKIKNVFVLFFSRSILLYILTAVIFILIVDKNKATVQRLNYLRDSARYLNSYSEREKAFDEVQLRMGIEYYEAIAKAMPQYPLTHGMIAFGYAAINKQEKAIREYEKAIAKDPQFFGFYFNLGLVYFQEGNWLKTIKVLEQAVNIKPDPSIAYYSYVGKNTFKNETVLNKWLQSEILLLKNGYEQAYKLLILSYDKVGEFNKMYALAIRSFNAGAFDKDFFQYYSEKAYSKINVSQHKAFNTNSYYETKVMKEALELKPFSYIPLYELAPYLK